MSYERQPPGLTLLSLLEVPATGGDTAWVSQVAAYDLLSEPIKKLLEGLTAEHDGFRQAENARKNGNFVRREPVRNEHPIVRVHPVCCSDIAYHNSCDRANDKFQVTGQKALYVNPGFTRRIIGLKDEESDAILKLLFHVSTPSLPCEVITLMTADANIPFQHITVAADVQVRVKWDNRTVTLWDNRVTAHTAISDYDVHNPEEGLRHGIRLTTLAEQPTGVENQRQTLSDE